MAPLTAYIRYTHEHCFSVLNHVYEHHYHHGASSYCVGMISSLGCNSQSKGREWKEGVRHRTEREGFLLRKVWFWVVFFSPTLRTKCEATDPPGKYNKMQKYSWNKNVPLPKCQNDVLTLLKAVVSVK